MITLSMVRATLAEVIGTKTMIFVLVLLGLAYVVTVAYMTIKNSYRTKLDWNKFYWDKKERKKCQED
jgi:hypothetical protein